MSTTTLNIEKMREIIHDEVLSAVREVIEEFEFMTEEDFRDREEALSQFEKGKGIDWEDYKKKRAGEARINKTMTTLHNKKTGI